jgi:capsular polysaccharide transport system permease protein
MGRWYDLLILLMLRNIGLRFQRSRLAVLLAILEPLGIIGLLSFAHSLLTRSPPFGSSFVLFYASGVLPYYLFFHTSLRMRAVALTNRLPRTTVFAVFLSHVLDEFFLKLIVMIMLFGALWFYGMSEAAPANPLRCLAAMAIFSILGIGFGLFYSVIAAFVVAWGYVYGLVARGLIMFSGVLHVLDWMPKDMRDIAVYLPFSHAVTLFRDGMYGNYPTQNLDVTYALLCGVGAIALGLLVYSAARPWLLVR